MKHSAVATSSSMHLVMIRKAQYRRDIMKILHYAVLLMHFNDKNAQILNLQPMKLKERTMKLFDNALAILKNFAGINNSILRSR